MPVGTQGSVKTLSPAEVAATGARVVLGNTYHLMLRPGAATIDRLGGLHGFTRWPHAMLTVSGGFQAFSLGAGGAAPSRVGATEEGFTFKSHLDGSTHVLTPEGAVRVQGLLGADIQMQLDVCPPGDSPRDVVEAAVARTTRWAHRALATPRPPRQALFGIVQGGCFVDLRRAHAAELAALDLPASTTASPSAASRSASPSHACTRRSSTSWSPALDPERPRYLMGVGKPADLLVAIGAGVDMFDCVLPTRNARNGQALTRFGRVVIKQARWHDDPRPIDQACSCPCCAGGYSRAAARHLYLAGEILALRLISQHNLHFYGELVAQARASRSIAGSTPRGLPSFISAMEAPDG